MEQSAQIASLERCQAMDKSPMMANLVKLAKKTEAQIQSEGCSKKELDATNAQCLPQAEGIYEIYVKLCVNLLGLWQIFFRVNRLLCK